MELYVIDRINISRILPENNSFLEYNLKQTILQKVGFGDEDVKTYELKQDGENLSWNTEKDSAKPTIVDFTDQELAYLKSACERLAVVPQPDHLWRTVEKIYNPDIS